MRLRPPPASAKKHIHFLLFLLGVIILAIVATLVWLGNLPQPEIAAPPPQPTKAATITDTNTSKATLTKLETTPGYIISEVTDKEVTFFKTAAGEKIKIFSLISENPSSVNGAISPDGKTIFYTDGNVMAYDLATGKTTKLKAGTAYQNVSGNTTTFFDLTLSPDGTKLGLRWAGWEWTGSAIMNSDGTNYQDIPSGFNAATVAFSPDSQRIILSSPSIVFSSGAAYLYVASVDAPNNGSNVLTKELTFPDGTQTTKDLFRPVWSPDATQIAFGYAWADDGDMGTTADNETLAISTIKSDGTGLKLITPKKNFQTHPIWLNNDTIIYGMSNLYTGTDKGIYAIKSNGTGVQKLFSDENRWYEPLKLSPDNKLLLYWAGRNNFESAAPDASLYLYNFETHTSEKIGQTIYDIYSLGFAGWAGY